MLTNKNNKPVVLKPTTKPPPVVLVGLCGAC